MRRIVGIFLGLVVLVTACSAGARQGSEGDGRDAPGADVAVGTDRTSNASASEVSPGDQRYEIAATYDADARRLSGSATIFFANTGATSLSTIHLRLWPNGQTTCSRAFVVVTQVVGGDAGAPDVGCTVLPISLDAAVAPGATSEISFHFADKVAPAWNFRYGVSGQAAMFGNAFPVLALTDAAGTHLEPYTLMGESMYSAVAEWDVRLTIPRGMKAATTGVVVGQERLGDGRSLLHISAPNERDFAMAIGRFRVYEAQAQGITIRYFRQPAGEPGSQARPETVLRWAREAVDSFTEHYGQYDQPEIDLAGTTWGANGSEFPSMLMVGINRDVIYHEIAHLWWYSMVGDNQWASSWADESFAEFSTRRLKGTNLDCNTAKPFAGIGGGLPLDTDMGTFDAQGNYVGTVYGGGPCVLEKLRRDWGDTTFDAFMAGLVADHSGGFVDTCIVIEAMRDGAPPGYDVDGFLQVARLDTAGCPEAQNA